MSVRPAMATLITRIRNMVNDPAGGSQHFDDQAIQDALDLTRLDFFQAPLSPVPKIVSGTLQYLDHYAPNGYGNWEEDVVLYDSAYAVISSGVTPDYLTGHWVLSTSRMLVYLTGKSYDLYRAAADLLEQWATKLAFAYDITVDGQSLHRSQMAAALVKLASQYRMKQRASAISVTRSDLGGTVGNRVIGPLPIDRFSSGGG